MKKSYEEEEKRNHLTFEMKSTYQKSFFIQGA